MRRFASIATLLCLCATINAADKPATGDGIFTPMLKRSLLDLNRTVAYPGKVKPADSVLRINKIDHNQWRPEKSDKVRDSQYMVAFKEDNPVGTVLFVGSHDVKYLKKGATGDPDSKSDWIAVPYAGKTGDTFRCVALPPGVSTKALLFTQRMQANKAGTFEDRLPMVSAFATRFVNIAPLADVSVSSARPPRTGFRPDPVLNTPQALNDAAIGADWTSAKRDTNVTPKAPEWVTLEWSETRNLRGCAVFVGRGGFGRIQVQQFVGKGGIDSGDPKAWKTIKEINARRPWRPFVYEFYVDFERPIKTRALRFLGVEGLTKERAHRGEGADATSIRLSEVLAFEALGLKPAPKRIIKQEKPNGVVPITFTMPKAGKATIQILDKDGMVVKNLVNGEEFEAGKNTVWWDLSTIEDYWAPYSPPKWHLEEQEHWKPVVMPGEFTWRGIWNPGLNLSYKHSYYPIKEHGMPWITADNTGGWLADHAPPRSLVRTGDTVWIGTFCEGGNAILESDMDMKKQWGSARLFLACPRIMAEDGDSVFFIATNGWSGRNIVIIEVDRKNKRSRRIMRHAYKTKEKHGDDAEPMEVHGFVVRGNTAYIGNRATNKVLIVDLTKNLAGGWRGYSNNTVNKTFENEDLTVLKEVSVDQPGRIRPYDDRTLAIISGKKVVLLDTKTHKIKPLISGLTNPMGLAIDKRKQVYVGEMEPLHVVKVFSRSGKLLKTIGKKGPHKIGRFDKENLESPAGVEVDARGNIWVAEYSHQVKRTSVWDINGKLVSQVIGPTMYGGSGTIDPDDENHFFYQGQEFRRDSKTGKVELTHIAWRSDDKTYDKFFQEAAHNFGGAAPSYAFRNKGKLFFTNWQGWSGGRSVTISVYDRDRIRPVGAVGMAPKWLYERMGIPETKHAQVFSWTDANNDGKVQPAEAQIGPITMKGKPVPRIAVTWNTRMNQNFEVAFTDNNYSGTGVAFFHVKNFNKYGYPEYTLPTKVLLGPASKHPADAAMTDREGNAIVLDNFVYSLSPKGKLNWRYKNLWPGLHAGHNASAMGNEPGVLIATTRFLGSAYVNSDVGEVFGIGSNLGSTFLMTTDGMYIDRIFKDVRRGLAWRVNTPPSDEIMNKLSISDEHFGGTFQKVRGADGKDKFQYVVGKTHCSVVELSGLGNVKRLKGGHLKVTGKHQTAAEKLRHDKAAAKAAAKKYVVKRASAIVVDGEAKEWDKERIDGFALTYDNDNLYVLFSGVDRRAVFQNSATGDNFLEAFKTGDIVDVKLQTSIKADAKRNNPVKGDIRLSFAMVGGKPQAILYDFVVPGTQRKDRNAFASPWRSIFIDRVTIKNDVKIAVKRKGQSYTLEASIPLSSINFKPTSGLKVKGDVGRVLSDQTGSSAVSREYWSNKSTNIVSDVPSEASIHPKLWGTFVFE